MAQIAFVGDDVEVDAELIASGLGLSVSELRKLMHAGAITGRAERGVEEDAGLHRLTFFHRGRRFRLIVDREGGVVRGSAVDFGDRPLPAALRKP
jgi:hypothetical protein